MVLKDKDNIRTAVLILVLVHHHQVKQQEVIVVFPTPQGVRERQLTIEKATAPL
jgi:hypothetical protein